MPIESLPTFTKPARQHWGTIPADLRQRLLSNAWCGQCRHETTITNFSGTIKGGDLLLVGKCAECRSDVARVISEVRWHRQHQCNEDEEHQGAVRTSVGAEAVCDQDRRAGTANL